MTAPLVVAIAGLRLVNKANGTHGHWSRAYRAAKAQRTAVVWALRGRPLPPLPIVVTITRVSPGALDPHDGLPNACKHVVDEIAAHYGRPDSDPAFTWVYRQRKDGRGNYAVEIEIAHREITHDG